MGKLWQFLLVVPFLLAGCVLAGANTTQANGGLHWQNYAIRFDGACLFSVDGGSKSYASDGVAHGWVQPGRHQLFVNCDSGIQTSVILHTSWWAEGWID